MMMHCCAEMHSLLDEGKVSISYSPRTRSYGIKLKGGSLAVQQISFCPWCGAKFPDDLRDRFFSEVTTVLRKEADFFNLDEAPDEFKSDEWWKKRGL